MMMYTQSSFHGDSGQGVVWCYMFVHLIEGNYQYSHSQYKSMYSNSIDHLLPTGSEEREVLGVGSIPDAILPSWQYMEMLHHNCIDINIVG